MQSKRPIRNKTPQAYETGAKPATPPPAGQLKKDDNWSTGEWNMKRQREQAHKDALKSEKKHYDNIHRFIKPKSRW
jgi:hypothetical protein